jgi:hypothetical protein
MKTLALTLAATLAAAVVCGPAQAAGEPSLQRLALCQDSWLEWKDDSVRMGAFQRYLEGDFERGAEDGAFAPKTPLKVLGQTVTQVYPQSVGMGVGFSVVVAAGAAQARAAIEQQIGKPMNCSTSEGVRACEVQLGAKKTAMLMTGQNGQAKTSLLGCFYFYQQ